MGLRETLCLCHDLAHFFPQPSAAPSASCASIHIVVEYRNTYEVCWESPARRIWRGQHDGRHHERKLAIVLIPFLILVLVIGAFGCGGGESKGSAVITSEGGVRTFGLVTI